MCTGQSSHSERASAEWQSSGGSHASDILHVLMGVSVAKLIIYNIVLLFICHNKRSSSSSSAVAPQFNLSFSFVSRFSKHLIEFIAIDS